MKGGRRRKVVTGRNHILVKGEAPCFVANFGLLVNCIMQILLKKINTMNKDIGNSENVNTMKLNVFKQMVK